MRQSACWIRRAIPLVGNGNKVVTTTTPDLGTNIQTLFFDGTLKSLTGTAVMPCRYSEDDGGGRLRRVQTKLDASGNDTSETISTSYNMLGQVANSQTPLGTTTFAYNSNGQLWKEADPDNVTRLYTYNALGERDYSILATTTGTQGTSSYEILLSNLSAILSGTDRVTRTVRTVLGPSDGKPYRTRVETQVWQEGQGSGTVVSASEVSTNGLQTWRITQPAPGKWLTNSTTATIGASRVVTAMNADGSYSLSAYTSGRLTSVTRYNSTPQQIGKDTHAYDTHGVRVRP
jgi:YD repeat-containing protein